MNVKNITLIFHILKELQSDELFVKGREIKKS